MDRNDLEQLFSENCEPVSLVNHVLKECSASLPEDLEKYCSELSFKLESIAQQETQKVNLELGEFKKNVSNFIRGSGQVQALVTTLEEELKRLQEQLSYSFEEEKVHGLQTLIQADRILSKLEETLTLLRHAKEVQDITDRLDSWRKSVDWEALGNAVRLFKSSLSHLKDVPQYNELQDHLQVMTNRFQELIRPQLYEYLSNKDSVSLRNVWACCEETNQKNIFIDVWVSERSSFIQKLWSNCWKSALPVFTNQQEMKGNYLNHLQVCLDVHVPESFDILKSFYEQVVTDMSQQISFISPVISQPLGNLITASVTMAFSSLEPPLADSYQVKQDLEIDWLADWSSVFEFYHNVMKECLLFTQKIASLAYYHQSSPFDVQGAISAVMDPAIKYIKDFRSLMDSVWCAWCRALLEKQNVNYLKQANAVQDAYSRISLLSRSVDHDLFDFHVMDSLINLCRQWILGSQLSSISILYLRFGRMVGDYILEKMSLEKSGCVDYFANMENNWNPIRYIFRLAVSVCRLQNSCWRLVCEGLNSCLIAIQPIMDRYCSLSDSSHASSLLEILVYEFIETKSIDIHEFVISWLIITDKKALDCIQFDSAKGPLGLAIHEFVNDPFEETLFSLRKTLLEMIFYRIQLNLDKLSELVMDTEEQRFSEEELDSASSTGLFGLSPQTCIVQTGEFLLVIPQMLEALAPEETLELALCLPRSFEKNDVVDIMKNGPDCQSLDRSEFVRQWLSVIGHWTMSYVVERIITDTKSKLTEYECKQLSTDIEYLKNIIAALGIPVLKQLQVVYELLLSSETQHSDLDVDEQNEVDCVFSIQNKFDLGRPLLRRLQSVDEIKQALATKKLSHAEISHS
ncbi:hypothetical protein Gasu2_01880 [Galdieria sulphuraria]|uniref:Conserved oligomeric Golgi complex subunit 7 n=1 Tax=Galdieria sulphuraria TaxID=130081 RepID=M2YAG8_GALSU|nr:uncharacterized protein Gasu_02200 [Galdieria sulphuraria]EME32869.1 hypothetical protein Gasu_02200 [Galdieria sulphuraria]GJD05734.1 hypothetical protein Gasu2_01880 [Galdieria sulphuraria]|eukprot:XP_005709389.1 hypothetical protein Gasu_02200 [Galdieria sulphuraria]